MCLDREMKRLHGESTDKSRESVRTVRVTLASIGTGDLLAFFLTPSKLLVPVLDKLVRGERRQRVGILLADFIEDGMIGEAEQGKLQAATAVWFVTRDPRPSLIVQMLGFQLG